jgi:hypothetical protein
MSVSLVRERDGLSVADMQNKASDIWKMVRVTGFYKACALPHSIRRY